MRYGLCHRMPSASHVRTQTCKLVRSAARPMLTLERLPQRASSLDEELWNTGAFDAQVLPDLPAATSLSALVAQWMSGKALQNGKSGNQGALDGSGPRNHDAVAPHVVATVACQLRSRRSLEELIRTRCAHMGGFSRTSALLLVSGGHPARRLPLLPSFLPSSLDTLAMAAQLRASQKLPGDLQLWAVANPNTERSAELVARKVELGAQAILTQPPLAWSRFEAWWEDVERRGIQNECKMLIGSGCISSPGNLAFWLALADVRGVPEAEQQLARFERASEGGKESFQKFAADWNEQQLRALMTLPGVAGIHFMPLTNAARRLALGLVSGDGAVMSRSIAGSQL